ncbi:MAG TPA: hypothetical protein VM490_13640 [Armatimonadaceae bacterium]|nr:hypothetical protein [Armatimonadaceae bacterium]
MDANPPAPLREPVPLTEELAAALHDLLLRYIEELDTGNHSGLWSLEETNRVRHIVEVLIRAGHAPRLPPSVQLHLNTGTRTP